MTVPLPSNLAPAAADRDPTVSEANVVLRVYDALVAGLNAEPRTRMQLQVAPASPEERASILATAQRLVASRRLRAEDW